MKKFLAVLMFAVAMSLTSMAQAATHSVQLACNELDVTAVQFHFYEGAVSGGPYTQLDTTKVTTCGFLDTAVAAGQTRFYISKATDILGTLSLASNEAKAVVPAIPAAPSGLTATVIP